MRAMPAWRPPGAPSGPLPARLLQERILLTGVLNHPWLLERVSERLGSIEFTDSNLDSLRRAILFEAATQSPLDPDGLTTNLSGKGHGDVMGGLQSAQVYQMADFTRPQAEQADVLTGWEHTFELYRDADVQHEQRRTAQLFETDDSDEIRAQMNVFVDRDIFTQD